MPGGNNFVKKNVIPGIGDFQSEHSSAADTFAHETHKISRKKQKEDVFHFVRFRVFRGQDAFYGKKR